MSFFELAQRLTVETAENRAAAIADGLQKLRAMVKGKEARLFIDGTPNFGHQATSVRVLYFLVDRLQPETILVRYKLGESGDPTGVKLALLIPGFDASKATQTFPMGETKVTVTFVPWETTPPPKDEAPFGATGAADQNLHYAKELNVAYFLRLQPYLWPGPGDPRAPNELQSLRDPPIALAAENVFGPTFPYRAFHVPKPQISAEEWTVLEKKGTPEEREAVKVARVLLEQKPENVHLGAAYSVGSRNQTGVAGEWILCAYGGGIAASQTAYPGPAAIAVVSVPSAVNLTFLLRGGKTEEEKKTEGDLVMAQETLERLLSTPRNERQGSVLDAEEAVNEYSRQLEEWKGRQEWLEKNVGQRATVLANPSPDQLVEALQALTDNQILFVLIVRHDARLPTPVFNLLFASTTLPGVFEGGTTASLALSVGNPYLQMLHMDLRATLPVLYPSEILKPNAYIGVAAGAQKAANALTAAIRVPSSQSNFYHFFVEVQRLQSFIKDCYVNSSSALGAYFQAIHDFYSLDVNDKLALGAGFTGLVMNGGGDTDVVH